MAVEIQQVYIDTPHRKQMIHAANILKKGGVIVYPTDTIYGLAADITQKKAIETILRIKKINKHKLLSFVFPNLKEIGDWVKVSNSTFRLMKKVLPGKYTFILPASKSVHKSILQKRQTIGIRVPNCEVSRCISIEMGMPILSASVPKGEDDYFTDPSEIAQMFGHEIDLILDSGIRPNKPSSIIDFSVDPPVIIREGEGDLSLF